MPLIDAWWQQVSGTATQGLQITVVGMSLVFLTLGLIILVLALLTRLPGLRVRNERQEPDTRPESTSPSELAAGRAEVAESELAQVAAIAVALMRTDEGNLGTGGRPPSTGSVSRWKQYGRAHQLGL